MLRLSEEIEDWLARSGWHKERVVPVANGVPIEHPAHAILASLGGIVLLEPDCGADDIPIEEFDFQLLADPCNFGNDWSSLLQSQLIGVAEIHNAHAELFVDERGRCFGNSRIHKLFWFNGNTLNDALQCELIHKRHQPMLHPDQTYVDSYGERIQRGDPRILDFKTLI